MKKKLLILALVSLIAACALVFTGCFGGGESSRKVTVRFDYGNGAEITSVEVDKGGKIDEPEVPVKEGFTFEGWYEGTSKIDFSERTFDYDMTLRAEWSEKIIKVLVDFGIEDREVFELKKGIDGFKYNDKIMGVPQYEEKGYDNLGNFIDKEFNTPLDINQPLKEDITIYVKFVAFDYKYELTEDGNSYRITHIGAALKGDITLPSEHNSKPVVDVDDAEYYNIDAQINKITVPSSYKKISRMVQTKQLILSEGLEEIGDDACKYLYITNINFPDSLKIIGEYAFSSCDLEDITLPATLTTIKDYAFAFNDKLRTATVAKEIGSIGGNLFQNCLNAIVFLPDGRNETMGAWNVDWEYSITYFENADKGDIFDFGGVRYVLLSDGSAVVAGLTIGDETEINIPAQLSTDLGDTPVMSMASNAFRDNKSLTEVTFGSDERPSFITEISYYAFFRCENLQKVDLPQNLRKICSSAFNDCAKLTGIVLPQSVTDIENRAFAVCVGLTEIYIPATVTYMGMFAVGHCENLVVSCEAAAKPDSWSENWFNYGSADFGAVKEVKWGVARA